MISLLVIAGVLGAVVGSFSNVVIWRLPRGESVVFPRSHCPNCDHQLGPLELVPILSWLALGGKCKNCRQPISVRYPLIEALVAAVYVLLVWQWSPLDYGLAVLPLLAVATLLVIAAAIDVDLYILPDVLVFSALLVALAGSFLWVSVPGLPAPVESLAGALVGAGVLVLINRLGALVLRRFADTNERLYPVSLDQANLAAVVGMIGGMWWGLAAGAASLLLNLLTRRQLRLPEQFVYGLWLVALVLTTTSFGVGTAAGLAGSVLAAGAWTLVGALYWWVHDLARPDLAKRAEDEAAKAAPEPVAMGFGDVKLAAVLGAFLGWERFLVGLLFAVVLGAVLGVAQRMAGGSRVIPFGPFLVAGAFAALFFGDALIAWYFGLLGVS